MLTLRGSRLPRPAGPSTSSEEADDLGLIPDGAVLVRGHRIEQLGPSRRILNLSEAKGAQIVDAAGCLVMPGFVDADVDLTGDSLNLTVLEKSAERLLEYGTTSVGTAASNKRTARFLSESLLPLTIQIRALETEIDGLCHPLTSYVNQTVPQQDRVPSVIASGFHPHHQPACSLQLAASIMAIESRMTLDAAIRAITIGAAQAIGVEEETGSLEPGKFADLVVLDVPDYHEIPYHFGVNLVRVVIRHGRVIYRRGELGWHED